jgi:hypothetical protein
MNPLIQLKTTPPLLITLTFLCFALLPRAQAVVPPPDGGYPGFNTAEGQNALFSLTTGSANTAVGWYSLFSNAEGSSNTAVGAGTLLFNTARENTAFGAAALLFNTTGVANTAVGAAALLNNTDGGFENTAIGAAALLHNTTGANNTATGDDALYSNTTGSRNTATGQRTLFINTTGSFNTATGDQALYTNTTGYANTANGIKALFSNTTGVGNIALGNGAGLYLTTGNFNIDIGSPGVGDEANTIRIGRQGTQTDTYIAGISGVTVAGGVGVIIDYSTGHLGTIQSSKRFKDAIKPMDKASEAILALKPVTFRYKHELDPDGIPQFGLVAEQVEKVNPDLVARDDQGKPYTVRYEAVNAMLLNEFLKEHKKVQALEATVAQQQKEIETLTATVKEQAAQIQKVSARVEASKPAPQVVNNP